MRLFEFQAKEAFAAAGIAVPRSSIASSVDEALRAAKELGFPCVLKAQVLRGGRGKAGLVRIAGDEGEARSAAAFIFDSSWGARKILIEEAIESEREIYLSIATDPKAAGATVLACAQGGVDIETLAAGSPELIVRESFGLDEGLMPYRARGVAYALGLEGDVAKKAASVIEALWKVFRAEDAELAEINPLFVTKAGALVAGDGKLAIDDNSLFRHPGREPGRDSFESGIAYEAAKEGIPYLQFDGDISLMCAGAGLTTTVYDLIADEGGSVANYLEFGGPNYRKAVRAMELCLMNSPKVVLIVTFGTIARADIMAEGIALAIAQLKPGCPIVACIRGTGEEKAVETLKGAGLDPLFDTEEAVKRAVALAAAARAAAPRAAAPRAAAPGARSSGPGAKRGRA